MAEFGPEILHRHLLERAPRILRFDREDYFPEWQSAVRRSFRQLLGLMPGRVGTEMEVVSEEVVREPVLHRVIRFEFTVEPGVRMACALVLPGEGAGPFATMICLQGHRGSAATSLKDGEGNDFAMQAVRRGYGALVMDMRCFGERRDQRSAVERQGHASGCHHASMVALLLGRTMVGERVWDVVRAIDVMVEHFPQVDGGRIGVLGYSVGGAIAYYAAAFEPRIAAVVSCGAVSTYASSLGAITHCVDAYIPNILHYFEMADIAGLIVPRPLVVVHGDADPLYPLGGVRECFGEIEEIYAEQGVAKACGLVVGAGGHGSYSELIWPALERVVNSAGARL